jgi:hypothetical protein
MAGRILSYFIHPLDMSEITTLSTGSGRSNGNAGELGYGTLSSFVGFAGSAVKIKCTVAGTGSLCPGYFSLENPPCQV